MSKTVDQRVVEMQFDNRQFERNVSTTMSTLDKLKQKLNLKGAADGLENVNAAAKKVNMSGLTGAIDTVHSKFSALEVMGVTALANITNSAVNAGKRMISALTIDPVRSGFQEYETQIGAVQTILANTSHEGKTIKDVNKALDELNTYADQTIYNFTEMTRNIGTFTAAGVGLDTSVSAIKGIANLAAVSGSTSQQASTAMYQLSQALAAGRVSLQDWNSVVNAGMGGKVFQDALTRTARVMGTGVDADIAKYGSFRESLSRGGWLTTDVLTETLNQFTMSAKEGSEEWNNFMATLQKKGYTKEQATEILKMANTATDAATKIKTFTQLWDVMKETAQSGWSQTWKLIFGDFEEAREMFTRLSKPILGFIEGMGNARNAIINSAFSKNFKGLVDSVKNIAKPAKEAIKNVEDLGKIVDKVINGDFGNGKKRFDELAKSGINYYRVQNQVNEKLGNSFRYTEKQIEAQDKLLGKQKDSTKATKDQSEATAEYIADLTKLSDAQLKELGYNEKQIEAIRELTQLSEKLGIPVKELIQNIDKIDGRWLFIESFANFGKSFMTVAKSIGQAWKDIFPSTAKDKGNALFEIIAGLHRISRGFFESTKDNADELKRTFKGLFAIVDILATILGGGFKIAFKVVSSILKAFNLNILDATAYIGDAIVKFRDFIDEALDFTDIFKKMKPYLVSFGKAVREAFVKSLPYLKQFRSFLKDKLADAIPYLKQFATYIKDAFVAAVPYVKAFANAIKNGFVALKNSRFAEIAKDCLLGFKDGLVSGAKGLWKFVKGIAGKILDTFSEMLGVQSPSWKFFEIARDCILGFVNGIGEFASNAWAAIKSFGSKVVDIIKAIDFGGILATVITTGITVSLVKIASAIESFASPFEGLGDIFESASKVLDTFRGTLKSFSATLKAKALKDIAISIGILALAVVALAFVPEDRLWSAVGALGAIAGMVTAMLGVIALIAHFNKEANPKDAAKSATSIAQIGFAMLSFAGSLLIVAYAMKVASGIDVKNGWPGLAILAGVLVVMTSVLIAYGQFAEVGNKASIDKAGGMMLQMSFALLVVAGVLKLASSIDAKRSWPGLVALAGALVLMGVVLVTYGALAKYDVASNIDKAGVLLFQMAASLLIVAYVMKLLSDMTWVDLATPTAVLIGFGVFVGVMSAVLKKIDPADCANLGTTMLGVAGAIGILALTLKLLSGFNWKEDWGAMTAMIVLSGVMAGLVAITKFAGKDIKGIGATMLMVAGAVGILAGISVVLGYVDSTKLTQGVVAVGILAAIIGGLIWVTKFAQDCKGNLIVITIAIAVLAASVAALSFIDPTKLTGATIALTSLMGMFAVILAATGNAQKCMGTLVMMTIVVGLLGGLIYILAQLPWQSTIAAAASMGILLGIMVGVIAILSKTSITIGQALTGALAMVALSASLIVLAQSLQMMGGMTWTEIAKGLVALAGAFIIIGVAGYALAGLSPVILALSAAFLIIGVGVIAAAAGIQMLATGITMLAAALSGGATTIVSGFMVLFTGLLSTVPILIQAFGVALLSLCNVVIQAAPSIAMAFTVVVASIIGALTTLVPMIVQLAVTAISSFLSAIATLIPQIVETGVRIVVALLNGLTTLIPRVVQAGITILLSILEGISKNIAKIVILAVKVVTEFLRGVAQSIPKVIQAAIDLMIAFINGMANAIRGNTDPMISAVDNLMNAVIGAVKKWFSKFVEKGKEIASKVGKGIKNKAGDVKDAIADVLSKAVSKISEKISDFTSAGKNVIDGFIGGIKDKVSAVGDAASQVGKSALNSIKKFLGIKSPSKEFRLVGRYADEGLIEGLLYFARGVSAAASDVGNTALDGVNRAMSDISNAVNSDIESQPTIRPVVDLTNIRNGANTIDGLLGGTAHVAAVADTQVIGHLMNQRIQNGNSNDVVAAINRLYKRLGNVGNTTNNINGITYDDGSNISEAVKAIVREARMGRRV